MTPKSTPTKTPVKDAQRTAVRKPAGAAAAAVPLRPRLRIRIRAYDHKLVDSSARQIIEAAERQGIAVVGPIPLPTEIRKYTVNRSTFKHKDSREQFEVRTHKRVIDISDPTPKTIDALTNLNLPAGVDIEIKMST